MHIYFCADIPSQEVHLLLSRLMLPDITVGGLTSKCKEKEKYSCLYDTISVKCSC